MQNDQKQTKTLPKGETNVPKKTQNEHKIQSLTKNIH